MSRPFPVHSICAILLLSAVAAGAQTRGIVPEDYYRLQTVGDPQLSPDGKLVAFVRTIVDKDKNRRVPSVWLAPTDGSAPPRQLTESI
ncbi:MAG: S9 family peptidase, partial [Bryobacteraceae bacterium]